MNAWTPIAPCDSGVTPPPAAVIFMEELVPTGVNALPALTHTPDGAFIMLLLNGVAFLPVGASPAFAIGGQVITWQSTIYSIAPTDSVSVAYSVSG